MAQSGLVAVTVALCLAGCVPARFSGYEPSGAGELEDGFCVAGIRDHLRIRAPAGVELLLYTTAHGYRPAVLLNVELTVPAGATAQWDSPRLTLRSPEWTRVRTLTIDRVIHGARTYAATAALDGASEPRARSYRLSFYATGAGTLAEPAIPLAGRFTLELPALRVNGAPFRVGPVQFEAYRRWGLFTCAQ